MRHVGWLHWRTGRNRLSGAQQNAARKLLGALRTRLKLGGVESGQDRAVLQDGTVVEVAWAGEQPIVRVIPPDPGGLPPDRIVCELYVESGLLDLGTPTSGTPRFSIDYPTFSDDPATIHFGTGVDCADLGGLNGDMQVGVRGNGSGLRSGCIGEAGESAPSRLSSPAKKRAQAALPASMWTGHMRRYVAALYGGASVTYELATAGGALAIGDKTVSPFAGNSWGLLKIEKSLAFVRITDEAIERRSANFDECGAAVLAYWRRMPTATEDDRRRADKVLTVALSRCRPGAVTNTIPLATAGTCTGTYGWTFDPDAPRAAAVLHDDDTVRLVQLVFSGETADDFEVVETVLEAASTPPEDFGPYVVSPSTTNMNAARVRISRSTGDLLPGASYDLPVQCRYDAGELSVVRYGLEVQAPVDLPTYWDCDFANISASGNAPQVVNCRGFNHYYDGEVETVPIVAGLYERRNGVNLWSQALPAELLLLRADPSEPDHEDTIEERIENYEIRALQPDGALIEGSETWVANSLTGGVAGINCGTDTQLFKPHCVYETYTDEASSGWDQVDPPPEPGCSYDKTFPVTVTNEFAVRLARINYFRGKISSSVSCALIQPLGAREVFIGGRYEVQAGSGFYGDYRTYSKYILSSAYTTQVYRHCGPSDPRNGTISADYVAMPPGEVCGGVTTSFLDVTGGPVSELVYPNKFTTPKDGISAVRGTESYRLLGPIDSQTHDGTIVYQTGGYGTFVPFSSTLGLKCVGLFNRFIGSYLTGDEIEKAYATKTSAVAERYFDGVDPIWCQFFQYRALRSLLDARIDPQVAADFGWSVGMDREVATGGYADVAWPSFVGWA